MAAGRRGRRGTLRAVGALASETNPLVRRASCVMRVGKKTLPKKQKTYPLCNARLRRQLAGPVSFVGRLGGEGEIAVHR